MQTECPPKAEERMLFKRTKNETQGRAMTATRLRVFRSPYTLSSTRIREATKIS